MKPSFLFSLCFCVVASGEASLLPPSLPAAKRTVAFSQLNNRDGVRRATAFLLARSEGENVRTEYAAALEKVVSPIKEACGKQAKFYRPDQSYMDLRKDFDEWKAASEAARILVQTDHHKDAKKFGEMDKAFEKASRAYDRL